MQEAGGTACRKDVAEYLNITNCKVVHSNSKKLITNGVYIMRPHTKFTFDWLKLANKHLDENYKLVLKNPSPCARHCDWSAAGYPIDWTALHGSIFHPLVFAYNKHVKFGLPTWSGGFYHD